MPSWVIWLLQLVFGSILRELLLALGVGALIAYLKTKKEKWAPPVLYGLIAFVLVFILGFTFTGRGVLSPVPVAITADNLKSILTQWISSYGLGVTEIIDDTTYFNLQVSLSTGKQLNIVRPKQQQLSQTLVIGMAFAASDLDLKHFSVLRPEQRNILLHDLKIEIARSNTEYDGVEFPLRRVVLSRILPISENLTSDQIFEEIRKVQKAGIVAQETVQEELEKDGAMQRSQ